MIIETNVALEHSRIEDPVHDEGGEEMRGKSSVKQQVLNNQSKIDSYGHN